MARIPGWLNRVLGGPQDDHAPDPDLAAMRERVDALERRVAAIDAMDIEIDVIVRRKPGEAPLFTSPAIEQARADRAHLNAVGEKK